MKDVEFKTFHLEMKEADEATGLIKGYASTFGNVDQGGDIVLPGAFSVTIKQKRGVFPILADHSPSNQIGWNRKADEDAKGLLVEGELLLKENQKAREKHAMAKRGLELQADSGLSIGYEVIQQDFLQTDGTVTSHRTWKNGEVRRLKEIRLWEYSLVTFPMNEEALLSGAKGWLEALTRKDNVTDSSKFFLETMKAQGYSESDVVKAVQALAAPAAPVMDPELLQSAGTTLDEMLKTLKRTA